MKPELLIDGDSFIYRAGFATEKTKYLVVVTADTFESFDDAKAAKAYADKHPDAVRWSRKEVEPVENAIHLLDLLMRDVYAKFPSITASTVYLSPELGNFRERIATRAKYKGNRDGAAKPTHFKSLRDRLISAHAASVTDGQEADDAIGIAQTANPEAICVSIDKDLDQVPGRKYNWVKKEEYTVSRKAAALFHYQQMLSGDTADNIPGLPGVGPVTAKKLLDGVSSPLAAWHVVTRAYEKEFGKEQGFKFALEAAQLTYIRRKPGELWSPPSA